MQLNLYIERLQIANEKAETWAHLEYSLTMTKERTMVHHQHKYSINIDFMSIIFYKMNR